MGSAVCSRGSRAENMEIRGVFKTKLDLQDEVGIYCIAYLS